MALEKHDLDKILEALQKEIKKYRLSKPEDGNTMVECMQQISAILFRLEIERSEYHDRYQNLIQEKILQGESVSRAENEANVKVPEMYLLRRIMESAYTVVDSIRTQISWIKTGLQ